MNKLTAGIGTCVSTTAGKLLIGAMIAAAAVGGAQATDSVHMPTAKLTGSQSDHGRPSDTQTDNGNGKPDQSDAATRHGNQVSDLAAGTDLQGCEKGQAIASLASANADDHRQNAGQLTPCDHANRSTTPDGAGTTDDTTHGNQVSDLATGANLQGCDKGQAIAALAAANASDRHQRADEPTPCGQITTSTSTTSTTASGAKTLTTQSASPTSTSTAATIATGTTSSSNCQHGQIVADSHRQSPTTNPVPCE